MLINWASSVAGFNYLMGKRFLCHMLNGTETTMTTRFDSENLAINIFIHPHSNISRNMLETVLVDVVVQSSRCGKARLKPRVRHMEASIEFFEVINTRNSSVAFIDSAVKFFLISHSSGEKKKSMTKATRERGEEAHDMANLPQHRTEDRRLHLNGFIWLNAKKLSLLIRESRPRREDRKKRQIF